VNSAHPMSEAQHAVPPDHVAKAEAVQDRRGHALHREVSGHVDEQHDAGLERRCAEADLEHERQQEWRHADGDSRREAGGQHAQRECRYCRGAQIEQRRRMTSRVADSGIPGSRPNRDKRATGQ
jgi:hypothetical protein